jgi:ATP-dependent Lon protease
MTGEIDLQGNITEIGGLDMKLDGGIRAGVTHFLYPKANHKDFLKWKEKKIENLENIRFDQVSTIEEVFKIIFV